MLPPAAFGLALQADFRTDATDYSAPDFDDSEWATGPPRSAHQEAGYNSGDVVTALLLNQCCPEYDPRFAATFATTLDK